MVREWLKGTKKEPFGVTLGCVSGMFRMHFGANICEFVMHWVKVVAAAIRIFD